MKKLRGRKWMIGGLVLSLGLIACKKDSLIIPESNDPVFNASGTIGSDAFEIVAGDNDAFMYTMTLEDQGVSVFTGRIADGNFTLEMGLYDAFVDKPGFHTEDELANLAASFARDPSEPILYLSRETLSTLEQSQFIETIHWFVNGEWKGQDDASISLPGKYEVCADIRFFGGQEQQLCNEVIVGYQLSANCSIDFTVSQQGSLVASMEVLGSPTDQIEQIKWYLDNSYIGDQDILFTQLLDGFHVLTADVKFSNGVERRKSVLVNGHQTYFTTNDFTIFESTSAAAGFTPRDFTLRLLVEKNGKKYSSLSADNSNAVINITGVELYGKNDAGNDVYKISAIVSAVLNEVGTTNMVPINFLTSFGIEIK